MKNNLIQKALLILMIFFLSGCSWKRSTSEPQFPLSTPTHTLQPSPMRSTPTHTPTIIVQTSNNSLLNSPQPRSTPRPTFSTDQAKNFLLELIQQPGGCRFPCFWGLIPGKTSLKTAQQFVSQFGNTVTKNIEVSSHDYGDVGGASLAYTINSIHVVVNFSYYKVQSSESVDLLRMFSYALNDYGPDPATGVTQLAPIWGTEEFNQEMSGYLLSAILNRYGPPDQVLVGTWLEEPDYYGRVTYRPFSLVLIYLQRGFMIEYQSLRESEGQDYIGCPYKSHINISTWDPKGNLPMEKIVEKASLEVAFGSLRSLEEATDLTMDSFYAQYSEDGAQLCIHTPANFWQLVP